LRSRSTSPTWLRSPLDEATARLGSRGCACQ
jgi:hypothetical protein